MAIKVKLINKFHAELKPLNAIAMKHLVATAINVDQQAYYAPFIQFAWEAKKDGNAMGF